MKKGKYKEVFIFVAGSTPQIITETIYALAMKRPPIHPDEIYIITTTTGRNHIYEHLIKREVLKSLQKEYAIPQIPISKESFIIVKDRDGNHLQDIRDEEENEAVGNLITDFIREKTRNMHSRLHCSLAGGRKTMSFYLGSALQLFGRPWDRLYHVLVTPEFESNPEFFYKPKKSKILKKNGRTLNTRDAEIHLAELPFIRLRDKISIHGKDFSELVREGQREIDIATIQPQIRVNLPERTIYIGGNLIEMVPFQLMLYTAYLRQKTQHCKHPAREYCFECTDCFATIVDFSTRPALEEMAEDYEQIYSKPMKAEELLAKHKDGLEQNLIRQNISKINKAIKEQLQDETLHPYYIITSMKKYAGSRYGVRVEKSKIRIE
jgi:CRISPR-associated protein Csx14